MEKYVLFNSHFSFSDALKTDLKKASNFFFFLWKLDQAAYITKL